MPTIVEAVKVRVYKVLEEVGEVKPTEDAMWLNVGSTVVSVQVTQKPQVPKRTLIRIVAPVLRDVPLSPGLFEYVARKSNSLIFGHLTLSEGSDSDHGYLLITHYLLGDYLDADELIEALKQIASAADDMDERLQKEFGGRRFWER